jgi:phage regulator Rha-like protein
MKDLTFNTTMSSREIASITGKEVKHVHELIKKIINIQGIDGRNFDHEEYQVVKDERGYTYEYLLNQRLSYFFTAQLNNKFLLTVIDRWMELEKANAERIKDNAEWTAIRNKGKVDRRIETDQIQLFISYAIGQGGSIKGCKMYYCNITTMCNKAMFKLEGKSKNWRDEMSQKQLTFISAIDQVVQTSLEAQMNEQIHYKRIYQNLKQRVLDVANAIGVTPLLSSEVKALLLEKGETSKRLT